MKTNKSIGFRNSHNHENSNTKKHVLSGTAQVEKQGTVLYLHDRPRTCSCMAIRQTNYDLLQGYEQSFVVSSFVGVLLSREEVSCRWSEVGIVAGALRESPTAGRQQWRPPKLDITQWISLGLSEFRLYTILEMPSCLGKWSQDQG
jgi:hypothetical protein